MKERQATTWNGLMMLLLLLGVLGGAWRWWFWGCAAGNPDGSWAASPER